MSVCALFLSIVPGRGRENKKELKMKKTPVAQIRRAYAQKGRMASGVETPREGHTEPPLCAQRQDEVLGFIAGVVHKGYPAPASRILR